MMHSACNVELGHVPDEDASVIGSACQHNFKSVVDGLQSVHWAPMTLWQCAVQLSGRQTIQLDGATKETAYDYVVSEDE